MVGRRERQNHAADTVQGGARGASRRELLLAGGASAPGAALAAAPAAGAFDRERHRGQTQEALNVAATIEVLTTIVTTTALQKLTLPQAAIDTVGAASREELDHHDVLTSEFGGRAATNKIWVPDAVFASPTALFTTLVVGEQICDRAFMKYSQRDQADGPGNGTTGFTTPQGATQSFEAAGSGFGTMGATPGSFYDFRTVRQNTPNPSFVNTLEPR